MVTDLAPESPVTVESPAESLQRHIEEHRKLAAELRERYGDPAASLGAFLRERYSPEAFLGEIAAYREDRASWLDEEIFDDDGR